MWSSDGAGDGRLLGVRNSRGSPMAVHRRALPAPKGDPTAVPAASRSRERRRSATTGTTSRGTPDGYDTDAEMTANGDRSHTRVTFEGTADRLPDIANSGRAPESRPGIVRLIRHAWKDRKTSGREGNIRRITSRRSTAVAAGGLSSATGVSPHHVREGTGSVSSGRAVPQPKANVPACRPPL